MASEQRLESTCRQRKRSRTPDLEVEDDVFIRKVHARPINGKYALIQKIGQGGFGAVYIGMINILRLSSALLILSQRMIL
jgi:hypothetical protein